MNYKTKYLRGETFAGEKLSCFVRFLAVFRETKSPRKQLKSKFTKVIPMWNVPKLSFPLKSTKILKIHFTSKRESLSPQKYSSDLIRESKSLNFCDFFFLAKLSLSESFSPWVQSDENGLMSATTPETCFC